MASAQPVTKKKSYDAAFKLLVIEHAEKSSNRGAGKKFNISESSVRDWRKQKNQLTDLPNKKKRLAGGGRKPLLDNEEELAVWIEAQ